jgi:anti-sigma B factor antagonist
VYRAGRESLPTGTQRTISEILMELQIKNVGDCKVVDVLEDVVDYTSCEDLKTRLVDVIEAGDVRAMVIDLERVTFMDSKAIGSLVSIRKAILKQGGVLGLCGLHPYVKKIITMVTLNTIFEVYDDKEQALEKMC